MRLQERDGLVDCEIFKGGIPATLPLVSVARLGLLGRGVQPNRTNHIETHTHC